ncbi:MAG TPA: 7-cyano-7-deazaguanine synthase QueC [Gemmatimonadales bacterium]|jgi:7-cyano-7-deazaguanine synthase
MARRAIVLLSGGLDSATTLAEARVQGFEVHALTVAYGQRHDVELDAARRVARQQAVKSHTIMHVDLGSLGGSALTGDGDVPKGRSASAMANGIPRTYVPARNTVLLSLGLARAETLQSGDVFIGVNAIDYSGYPDCRPEYIVAYEAMANLATKGAVERAYPVTIHTPLIRLTKAQIIGRGLELGVDYSLTRSCYDPADGGVACGECDACVLRLKGFAELGVPDPIAYVTSVTSS